MLSSTTCPGILDSERGKKRGGEGGGGDANEVKNRHYDLRVPPQCPSCQACSSLEVLQILSWVISYTGMYFFSSLMFFIIYLLYFVILFISDVLFHRHLMVEKDSKYPIFTKVHEQFKAELLRVCSLPPLFLSSITIPPFPLELFHRFLSLLSFHSFLLIILCSLNKEWMC